MKVKTFVVGTINGLGKSFEWLDYCVKDLGDIEIIEIFDTMYCINEHDKKREGANESPHMVRRVTYK